MTGSNFAGSAALYSKLPFDAVKDFSGITQFASTPLVLVVIARASGAKSVKELIALAREKPGQLNYASTGLGSGPHYGAELFKLSAGIKAVHVPYRGSPESLTDLMAGRVHFILSPVLAASPLIKSGKVLALGVTTTYRAAGAAGRADDRGSGSAEIRVPGLVRHAGAVEDADARSSTCWRRRSATSSIRPRSRSASPSQGASRQIEHAGSVRQDGPRRDRDAPQCVEGRGREGGVILP